jgi:serine phosphatase RsbU (regulator of sigma subunit)
MDFSESYTEAFREYLLESGEAALQTAYRLGRRAMEEGLTVLDLAEAHHNAMARVLDDRGDHEEQRQTAKAGAEFLREALSAYEMVQRGFREVQEAARLEQHYADQLRALADGSTYLNSTFSVEQILERMAELAPRIIGARRCLVAVPPEGSRQLRYAVRSDWEPPISPDLLSRFDGDVARLRAPNGEELLVGKVRNLASGHAIVVLGEKEDGQFTERDEAVLLKLSETCSVAIERAGLYERQRHIAETLQRALLPDRLPEVPGLALATRYLPGGAGENVGGDWYDLVVLPDGQVGLALGDVVGRGIRAASVMGQVRMAFRAYAIEHQGPAAVIDRVAGLLTSIDPQHFSTLVYLTLGVATGVGRMARAGHPPPLLVSQQGQARFLQEILSPPLCLVSRPGYEESEFEMSPGDTLVLYSDGLIGRRELDAGMSRMREVAASADGDPEFLCDRILESMPLDSEDDVALLAVRLG